jgi:aminopeptidase
MNYLENLEKYASLAVNIGINVQKGQEVILNAPINAVDLTRLITKKCYEAGASDVIVRYRDDIITHTKLEYSSLELLENVRKWEIDGLLKNHVKKGAALLSIISSDPDLMSDIDASKMKTYTISQQKAAREYKDYVLGGNSPWSLVAYPNKEWAERVFPDLKGQDAISKLWEHIFEITRIDQEDPIAAWAEHVRNINEKVDFLNNNKMKKLIYKSNGTDLTIELSEKHLWCGADDETLGKNKIKYLANIPTEEIFTLPKKDGINGYVSSTKPLSYNGNLIENFKITFENGRIVDYSAKKGEEYLKNLIDTDEGSKYIGEVALVPHKSPISDKNTIYYNTLFDENASCHLAIGNAYLSCIENGNEMTKEELEKVGFNTSLSHVDFMIGSSDLNIIGITFDNKEIKIFENGNWAF